jgi:hypothetical protein
MAETELQENLNHAPTKSGPKRGNLLRHYRSRTSSLGTTIVGYVFQL